jgi:phage anti-repressor protein
MKKKSDGMSPDMFHDATSSTPIPVFTSINEGTKNESPNLLQKETEGTPIQNELIRIDFDKQTVSARALYDFLDLTERFSKWFKRMISYGLVENVDFTVVSFWVVYNPKQTEDLTSVIDGLEGVPNGTPSVTDDWEGVPFGTPSAQQNIGDYLLTIEAAKHIAMVQRNEKGKQARNYFINIEKLYLKNLYSKTPTVETPISLLENLDRIVAQLDHLRSSIVLLEKGNAQRHQLQKNYDSLIEKTIALEKTVVEQATVSNLKDEYIERTISKKIDIALKTSFREADQISGSNEWVNRLPRTTNQNSVVVLNQLEKNLQKTTLEEDLIRQEYRPADRKTEKALFLTATEITHRLELFSKRVTVRNVGMALKKLAFERVPHSQKGGKVKGYFVIELY